MHTFTRIIEEALHKPCDVLTYELSRRLRQVYPDKYILETEDSDFELKAFVNAGRCQVKVRDDAHSQVEADWTSKEQGGTIGPRNSFLDIRWEGHRFKLLAITYDGGCSRRYYLVADGAAAAKEFFTRVCAFSSEVHGEILVYKNGG